MSADTYDVAILGAGLSGTITAAILARRGYRVVMLERGAHPRFTIGESMLPQTSMWLWLLGERFDVPEIRALSTREATWRRVSDACGAKKMIGFVHHEPGGEAAAERNHMLIPPETPINSESHLFRQDTDQQLLFAAIGHGAEYRDNAAIRTIRVHDRGVTVQVDGGAPVETRFVVDCTGYRSPLADQLGLREEPCRLRTHTRSLFTHAIGVRPFGECVAGLPAHGAAWHEGTLHHVFDGGWFWVIPFDNHAGARSPLCSVGLTVDARRSPRSREASPQAEVDAVLARFPQIAAHLGGARPVRRWIATDRIQYSSRRSAGPRWFLLGHAYGFVDALFSRGMASTVEVIHSLVPRLCAALDDDDFAVERFAYLEQLQRRLLDDADAMVHSAYVAFRSFALWDAWVRVWLLATFWGDLRLFGRCAKFLGTRDPAVLDQMERDPLPGSACPSLEGCVHLVRAAAAVIDEVEAGARSPGAATEAIFELLGRAEFLPPFFAWTDPAARHVHLPFERLPALFEWGRTEAPAGLRERLFDFDPSVLASFPAPG